MFEQLKLLREATREASGIGLGSAGRSGQSGLREWSGQDSRGDILSAARCAEAHEGTSSGARPRLEFGLGGLGEA